MPITAPAGISSRERQQGGVESATGTHAQAAPMHLITHFGCGCAEGMTMFACLPTLERPNCSSAGTLRLVARPAAVSLLEGEGSRAAAQPK